MWNDYTVGGVSLDTAKTRLRKIVPEVNDLLHLVDDVEHRGHNGLILDHREIKRIANRIKELCSEENF